MNTKMSFDSAPSQRRKDENGFMHVDSSHITKEQVVKYYGREIPGWQELKLDPERLYNVYRPADEIEKAAPTFDGLPLLLQHHLESADEPQKEFRVGSISRPVWNAPYLDCDLHITDGAAIDAIEHGDFKEISAAYLYDPVLERGTFDGDDYEIVMRNLRGNHVALVEKGRAGADVVVADSAPRILRSFAAWVRRNPLALKDTPTAAWENTKAAMDDAWITVQSNGGGRHVLLGDDGTIKAGMGGKFNGQRIDLIPRAPKAPPSANGVVSRVSTRYNISQPHGGGGSATMKSGTNLREVLKSAEMQKGEDGKGAKGNSIQREWAERELKTALEEQKNKGFGFPDWHWENTLDLLETWDKVDNAQARENIYNELKQYNPGAVERVRLWEKIRSLQRIHGTLKNNPNETYKEHTDSHHCN